MVWTIVLIIYVLGFVAFLGPCVNFAREIRIGGRLMAYHKFTLFYLGVGVVVALFWPILLLVRIGMRLMG